MDSQFSSPKLIIGFICRNYYDNTTFCFCDFDQFCNSVSKPGVSSAMMIIMSVVAYTTSWLLF
jgi:hypothetical protein